MAKAPVAAMTMSRFMSGRTVRADMSALGSTCHMPARVAHNHKATAAGGADASCLKATRSDPCSHTDTARPRSQAMPLMAHKRTRPWRLKNVSVEFREQVPPQHAQPSRGPAVCRVGSIPVAATAARMSSFPAASPVVSTVSFLVKRSKASRLSSPTRGRRALLRTAISSGQSIFSMKRVSRGMETSLWYQDRNSPKPGEPGMPAGQTRLEVCSHWRMQVEAAWAINIEIHSHLLLAEVVPAHGPVNRESEDVRPARVMDNGNVSGQREKARLQPGLRESQCWRKSSSEGLPCRLRACRSAA